MIRRVRTARRAAHLLFGERRPLLRRQVALVEHGVVWVGGVDVFEKVDQVLEAPGGYEALTPHCGVYPAGRVGTHAHDVIDYL